MNTAENTIDLRKPQIFDFKECLHFLDRGYDDCLYQLRADRVIKPLQADGKQFLIQIRESGDHLRAEVLAGDLTPPAQEQAGRYVTEWFDLDQELDDFYALLREQPRLAFMPEKYYGLRLMGIPDLFEALCWCVIGQQINLTFAYRLKRALVETYGERIVYDDNSYYYFPDAEKLAGLSVEELKELQFSRQKAEYITGIAREFAEGNFSKAALSRLEDTEAMLSRLKQIRGVGDWTANYALMKCLRRKDCITYGDTGLQSAVSALSGLDRKPTRSEVESFFAPLSGWESYLVIYLWRTLS